MPQEKLIDDVMAFICERGIAAGRYVGFGREDAKELIALIGKAYADGEMPLPGEVGRGPIIDRGGKKSILLPGGEWIAIFEGSPCTFIALSGTAKEEEK